MIQDKAALDNQMHNAGDRTILARWVTLALLFLSVAIFIISLNAGPITISSLSLVWMWVGGTLSDDTIREQIVLFDIRLPRTCLGFLVGGALGVAGSLMQGLFRNPLAEPGIVGVSSGAALAAITIIVVGDLYLGWFMDQFSTFAIPVAAFLGSLITIILLYGISTQSGQTSTATMLLAGIAIAALANAVTGVFVFIATDQQLRDLTFWTLGSLGGATWDKVMAAGIFIIPSFVASLFLGRGLNGLLLGEAEAHYLGINVQWTKRAVILLVACAAGAAVSVAGIIGFIGIIVPHLIRLLIGPDHKFIIPTSMLLGGSLLICADMVARTIVTPAELPIGIVTALIGAPFFLWLLLKRRVIVDV